MIGLAVLNDSLVNVYTTICLLIVLMTFCFFIDALKRMNGILKLIPILRKSEQMFTALCVVYGLAVIYFVSLIFYNVFKQQIPFLAYSVSLKTTACILGFFMAVILSAT